MKKTTIVILSLLLTACVSERDERLSRQHKLYPQMQYELVTGGQEYSCQAVIPGMAQNCVDTNGDLVDIVLFQGQVATITQLKDK